MNKIQVLDCTLRDGGYCNQWEFGFGNIVKIVQGLVNANVDIIECGFLTNKFDYDEEKTQFANLQELSGIVPKKHNNQIFVVMLNYGEYRIEDIPECNMVSIDGVRVAFHKKNMKQALELCKAIKKKGYKVFVQAMISLNYTDEEFLSLICSVNEIEPYAFYIVDSFGMMKQKNLYRLFYMVENNLNDSIWIGFHSHNNMQLAYSNAQGLVDLRTNRNLIIDCSIYGMGRGAGNLNTELFVEYLNENFNKDYFLKPLLSIIDEILNNFYQKNPWGYSLPNYLSAKHWVHPNYAGYFSEKNTLTVEAMDEIFSIMPKEKKMEYEKEYAEYIYEKYMTKGVAQEKHKVDLQEKIKDKKVVLLAPGRNIKYEKDKIISFISENSVILISINGENEDIDSDYIFVSNLRRFRELSEDKYNKCIVTTNIPNDSAYIQTKYFDLLNSTEVVRDNAGMMAIQYFINMGLKEVYLAGFDGYSHDPENNYASPHKILIEKNYRIDAMNRGIKKVLDNYKKIINIIFITSSIFDN